MISSLSPKLFETSLVEYRQANCLRNRLRGYSCRRCVDSCISQALQEKSDVIRHSPESCTGCGLCVAACPGEAFSFENVDLNRLLEEQVTKADLVVSCRRNSYSSENELRLPCVAVLPAEAIIFWGLRQQGDVWFNLSGCSACQNRQAADAFTLLLRDVKKLAGHHFRNRLLPVHTEDELPQTKQADRRAFLTSLGGHVARTVQNQFTPGPAAKHTNTKGRRVPARTRLLRNALSLETDKRQLLTGACTPDAAITASCSLCPRCTGMCPTGALKIIREQGEKQLSYDRTLCTACELCVEFCKDQAISIRQPEISLALAGSDTG